MQIFEKYVARFTHDPCPSISQCKEKGILQSLIGLLMLVKGSNQFGSMLPNFKYCMFKKMTMWKVLSTLHPNLFKVLKLTQFCQAILKHQFCSSELEKLN